MVDRACGCETDRLRRHVEGRLGEDEQELLAAHLDRCEQCRGSLDALAGDDGLWRDLRFFLVGEPDLSTAAGRAGRPGSGRGAGTACVTMTGMGGGPSSPSSILRRTPVTWVPWVRIRSLRSSAEGGWAWS